MSLGRRAKEGRQKVSQKREEDKRGEITSKDEDRGEQSTGEERKGSLYSVTTY